MSEWVFDLMFFVGSQNAVASVSRVRYSVGTGRPQHARPTGNSTRSTSEDARTGARVLSGSETTTAQRRVTVGRGQCVLVHVDELDLARST